MRQYLDQAAAPAAEREQMPPCGSRLSVACTSSAKPAKPLRMSVWPAAKQSPRRPEWDHRRRLLFASALISADIVAASTRSPDPHPTAGCNLDLDHPNALCQGARWEQAPRSPAQR
jgi:hypothetical protein